MSANQTKLINGEMLSLEDIVKKHEMLVHSVCKYYRSRAKNLRIDYEDIASVGFIGLIRAFERFDGSKFDVRFSTYAIPTIRGEVQRFLREQNEGLKYSRSIKELAWLILEKELEDLTIEEISKTLKEKVEKVKFAIQFIHNRSPYSLEYPVVDEAGKSTYLSDFVGDDDDHTNLMVEEFIKTLNDKEKVIVNCLINGEVQSSIGEKIGTSQAQVSRSIHKIRNKYLNYVSGNSDQVKKPKKRMVPIPLDGGGFVGNSPAQTRSFNHFSNSR